MNIEELLEKGQNEEAEKELMGFLNRLDMAREYPYCSIPIINVILTEKIAKINSEGIKTEVDIQIREELSIKQLDLCSAFGNILDNALRACIQLKKTSDGKADLYVKLKAKCVGEYLIIRCENSCQKKQVRFAEGSGYGLKILKGIAERYRGNLKTYAKGDIFVVQLSIGMKK